MTIQMTAKKSFRYGTRMLTAGDPFDASGESEARLFAALGRADRKPAEEVAEPAPVPAKRTRAHAAPPATDAHVAVGSTRFSDGEVQTEESLAAADPGLVGSVEEPRPKRKYTRRNLTAE